jgi:hypothetical protein
MDTLVHQKARPLQSNIDLRESSLKTVMDNYSGLHSVLTAKDGGVMARPETDALWFYAQQHAMGLIERSLDSDEPLGDFGWYVNMYHEQVQLKALRMFYYLLLICTRESRHMKTGAGKVSLYAKYPSIVDFHSNHVQDSSADASINAICQNAPDVTLGEYTSFLVNAFTMPGYNGGYGGKAWAAVARPLRDFVHGNISAEILMDTAFTLAHNNGPIFNKGMLYHTYEGNSLIKILDVQRSGQIPQLIANNHLTGKFVPALMLEYVHGFSKLDSGFAGSVDWKRVKNINGVACYGSEIAKQEAASPGANWKAKMVAVKAAAAEKAAHLKAQAAKAALLKGSIEILPGTWIAKGKRSQS